MQGVSGFALPAVIALPTRLSGCNPLIATVKQHAVRVLAGASLVH